MKLLAMRLCEHDSNFSYYDGNVIKYHKTERTHQIKHHAINNLDDWKQEIELVWGLDYSDIDEISIVVDPWRYQLPIPPLFFPSIEFNNLNVNCNVVQVNHHYAHALSSWMLGDSDVSFVFDGFGDSDVAWSVIRGDKLIEIGSEKEHGSIGLLISEAANILGIKAEHGVDLAGKLMGLQSYGNLDLGYLSLLKTFDLYSIKSVFDFNKWIEYKTDSTVANLTKLDWIKTVHTRVGEILVDFFKLYAKPEDTISFSGGVAQNVIWNTELRKVFPNIIIPPHCADDGLSLGALEYLRIKNNLPKFILPNFPYCQSDESVESPSDTTINKIAQLLSEGNIVAWYQGNGEIGPRALGNRSILMDPRISNGKQKINSIKNREYYRPFGASVLKEYCSEYFTPSYDTPYMLYVCKTIRENLQSITHVDGTCRIQTVESDSIFGQLLQQFYKITNCPVLLNTSLNAAGKPIVGSVEDAKSEFFAKNINYLVVGDKIYQK
jgi:carbamoyltransferase